ncbi:hypothetical protein ES705_36088 [subsurface metagenome]
MKTEDFSKYEISRILGARALQISMNAPLLIKISTEDLIKINYDALKIAEIELNSDVLPISVKRPLPKRKEEGLKRAKGNKISEKIVKEKEFSEEEDIAKQGEIMELANPEDEQEDYGELSEEKE